MNGFRGLRLPARHALASCECHTAYTRDVPSLLLPERYHDFPRRDREPNFPLNNNSPFAAIEITVVIPLCLFGAGLFGPVRLHRFTEAGRVAMRTVFGGRRIVDMLVGEQLPRIC